VDQLPLFDSWDAITAPDKPGRYRGAAVVFTSMLPEHDGRLVHFSLSSSRRSFSTIMIRFDRDITFLDVETLGIPKEAPIWEFAAIRVAGSQSTSPGQVIGCQQFFIDHDPGNWLHELPEAFQLDYLTRYTPVDAFPRQHAVAQIQALTDGGAMIAGSNAGFDMERLEILLRAEGLTPGWHYHPLDIASMAVGRISAAADDLELTWRSDDLSGRIGINSAGFERHTAMGDVRWCVEQYKAMGGAIHL
jgi:hypothetical protein